MRAVRLIAIVLGGLWASNASAQTLSPNYPVTNSIVEDLVADGDTIYAAGSFTQVGYQEDYRSLTDLKTGNPRLNNLPQISGNIYDIIPDGSNGWFIAGQFTIVGQSTRRNLIRVDSTGTLMTTWDCYPNSAVYSIVRNGNALVVGGSFSTIEDLGSGITSNRSYLASCQISNSSVLAWAPALNSQVYDISMIGTTIYPMGIFTTVNAVNRSYVCSFTAYTTTATGTLTSFAPVLNNRPVDAIGSGTDVWLAGQFTTVQQGGVNANRPALAKFASATGNADTLFNAQLQNQTVYDLLLDGASNLLVAGSISSINAVALPTNNRHLIRVNRATGVSQNLALGINSTVNTINRYVGRLFVGGSFSQVLNGANLIARNYFAVYDSATLALDSNYDAGFNSTVNGFGIQNNRAFVFGSFTSSGLRNRGYGFAYRISTGEVLSFNPRLTSSSRRIAVANGRVYYVGGFTNSNGNTRGYGAAFNTATYTLHSWNPSANSQVNDILIAGTNVYLGGYFSSLGGAARSYIGAVNNSTGAQIPAFASSTSNVVWTVEMRGSVIYAGGNFTQANGVARNYLASFNAADGLLTTWNPNASSNVYDLELANDTFFVAGDFTSMNGVVGHNRVTRILPTGTGSAFLLDSLPVINATVYRLLVDNSFLYLGGTFSNFNGISGLSYQAVVNRSTGRRATNWNARFSSYVYAFLRYTNGIAFGGSFYYVNMQGAAPSIVRQYIAHTTPAQAPTAITCTVSSNTLCPGGANFTVNFNAISLTPAANNVYTVQRSSSAGSFAAPVSVGTLTSTATSGTITCQLPLNTTPGTGYRLRVVSSNAAFTGTDNGSNITVNAAPPTSTIAVTVAPGTPQPFAAATVVMLSVPNNAGYSYQWYTVVGTTYTPIAAATAFSYNPTVSGTYAVNVTSTSGCTRFSVNVPIAFQATPGAITTTTPTPNSICTPGGAVSVAFTATGTFNVGNVFTAQASDASGSFASPTVLGTLAGTASGTIAGNWPASLGAGAGYLIRVVSSNPVATGPTAGFVVNAGAPNATLCAVTVNNTNNRTVLTWEKAALSNVDSFVIYGMVNGLQTRLAAQPFSAFTQWTDNTSDVRVRAYRYFIASKNACGLGTISSSHRTMHLTIGRGQAGTTFNLTWNGYEGFPHTRYEILKGTTVANLAVIATVEAFAFNSYTDLAGSTTALYAVRVANGPACNPSKNEGEGEIWSNIVSAGEEAAAAVALNLYPNPSNQAGATLEGPVASYQLADASGRVVESRPVTGDRANVGAGLPAGVYILRANRADGLVQTMRLVVSN